MTARDLPPVRGRRVTARRMGRRLAGSEPLLLVALVVLTILLALGASASGSAAPIALFVLPLLVGGLFLTYRALVPLVVVVLGAGVAAAVLPIGSAIGARLSSLLVVVVTAIFMLTLARARARLGLGVSGTMGEEMLVDLRDRLRAQGELPPLPHGWRAELALRPAGGASFSGDFVVSAREPRSSLVELALVDVSGKGVGAGTRALLLSGAFGGLLGSLPPSEFLSAANAYLLRQRWSEGFATAVHLALDLATGEFELRSAGHPPAVRFHAGSGKWSLLPAEGPALGVVAAATYEVVRGQLGRGDALLLYSDGLVETPRRDIGVGIDKLQGEAERLVPHGFSGGARLLVDRVGAFEGDDRALLLIWRT